MPHRVLRSLQALILAGLGLFLLHKIWTGTLFWYINQRFLILVLAAGLALLALARVVLTTGQALSSQGEHAGHGHDHEHGASGWTLLWVALPLLMGVLVPARPLSSAAIANKGLNTGAPLTAAEAAASAEVRLPPTERTVLDWVRAFNYATDTSTLAEQPADVVGFVYHDSRLADGEFLVSRFAVTCCAADAVAVGMLVQWPHATSLENNAWVRVRGTVQPGSYAGRNIPLIVAGSVEGVAQPEQPYLYP